MEENRKAHEIGKEFEGMQEKIGEEEWRDALIIVKVIHLWHSQAIKTEQNKTFTRLLNTTCCNKLIGIP